MQEIYFNRVVEMLCREITVDETIVRNSIEAPTNPYCGDMVSTIAWYIAKEQKRNPIPVAEELVENLQEAVENDNLIERMVVQGPYINIFLVRNEVQCQE